MRLKTFTDTELQAVFQAIQNSHEEETKNDFDDSNAITEDHIRSFLEKRFSELEGENDFISAHDEEMTSTLRRKFAEVEAKRCWKFFEAKRVGDSQLTQEELVSQVGNTARSLDMKRIWPITLSMLLVGLSVGVVTPAMPFVVQNLGLSAGEYGLVVSAFALAKMTGNVPSAVLVERHGRKVSGFWNGCVCGNRVQRCSLAVHLSHIWYTRWRRLLLELEALAWQVVLNTCTCAASSQDWELQA
jgi:hypothetical protein